MKIHIKTPLITLNIEDEVTIHHDGYIKRDVPKTIDAVSAAINDAMRLHNEVAKTSFNAKSQ